MKKYPYRPHYLLFIFGSLLYAPQIESANIVCDLGDVLVETRMLKSLWQLGPFALTYYTASLKSPLNCHKKLFDFLNSIKPLEPGEPLVRDGHNHVLPQLMNDWLKGTISGKDILSLMKETPGSFSNWAEESLTRALAHMIFTPESFVSTRYLVPEGIQFIHDCKAAGHKLYILSNWDSTSFALLRKKYPDFFNLFDGILISGDIGILKPDPRIFSYLLEHFQLDPTQTFYIDDRPENIAVAMICGIQSFLYKKKECLLFHSHDFQEVKKHLNEWLISLDNLQIPTDNQRYEHQQ